MKTIIYGDKHKDAILLLHGGGLSYWNYKKEAELLKDNFCVVLPVLDGHTGSDSIFTSIEDCADRIISYIDENFNGKVLLIGGLSLGAQVVVEILSKRNDIASYAIIESASLIPSKLTHALISLSISMSYGLIKKKWFSKLQFKSLHISEDYFSDYYRDTCKISKKDMISFLKANTNYEPKEGLGTCLVKTRIIVGKKEPRKMRKSAKILNQLLPESYLEIKNKYYHGDYSLNHEREYVDDLLRMIKK